MQDRQLEELCEHGDFFGVLRMIEATHPGFPRIGQAHHPDHEPIRFRQPASLAFATRTMEPLERKNGRLTLGVNFLGLLGPNGPLPAHLTEFVRDRQRNAHDGTLAGFLDIFHQRMLSLFYRAWSLCDKACDLDRPQSARFSSFFGSFFGDENPTGSGHDCLPPHARLYYCGQLGRQTRGADGLEAILADFFEVATTVEPLVGHWLEIPPACRTGLGFPVENAILGETAVLGETIWDVQSRFCIHIGPVGYKRFTDFLPGSRSAGRLIDWVRHYTLGEYQWTLHLTLKKEEVPPATLGGSSRLGWTTWVTSGPMEYDADDLDLILQTTFDTHN